MVRHALRRGFLLLLGGSVLGVVVGVVTDSRGVMPSKGVLRVAAVWGAVALAFVVPVVMAGARRSWIARKE